MEIIKTITLISFLYFSITSCKDLECNVADFEGTVAGSFSTESTCPANLPENFILEASIKLDMDVAVKNEDSIVYQINFSGATNEIGCMFQFFDSEGKNYVGDGTLLDDVLTLSYRNNAGDFICTYSGTVQN